MGPKFFIVHAKGIKRANDKTVPAEPGGQGAFVLPGLIELEEKCVQSIKRSCIYTYCPLLDFQTFRRL